MVRYLVRRFITMLLSLLVISALVFIIIKLPPGDFLTTQIEELRAQGENVNAKQIEELRQRYGLDQPGYVQYFNDVPATLVALHVAGATAVFVAAVRVVLGTGRLDVRARRPDWAHPASVG